jgi:divalent metal cation (Fe/Co/Zn/Cd) transporter
VRAFISAYPGITAVQELLVTYIGRGQVWVLARINVADNLGSGQVTALVRGIEDGMKQQSPYIYRVDVVPVGED